MAWQFPWGKYRASDPTLTDGQSIQPNLDVNGNLRISHGTKINSETLSTGGSGILGWLSEVAARVATIANSASISITAPQAKSISFDTGFTTQTTSATAYQWKTLTLLNVPGPDDGHVFIPMVFYFISQGTVYGRLVEKTLMATSQNGTAFTDGLASYSSDHEYWAKVRAEVVTPVNTNCTFTVTYTNELGQTGRTATAAITTTMAAGSRVRLTLQGSDQGMVDITNVTQSVGITAGKVEFYGVKVFTILASADTNQTHIDQAPVSLNGAAMRQGRQMAVEFASPDVSTSRIMIAGFVGNLQNEV